MEKKSHLKSTSNCNYIFFLFLILLTGNLQTLRGQRTTLWASLCKMNGQDELNKHVPDSPEVSGVFFSRLFHVTEGVIQRLVRDSVSCCSMMFVFRSLCRKEKQNHKNVNLVVSQKQHTLKFSKVATTAAWNLSLQSLIPGQVCSRPVFWELLRMTPPSAEDSHLSGLSLGVSIDFFMRPPYEWIKYIRLLLKSGLLFKDWFWCRLHRWLPLPVWTFHTRGHRSCFSLQPSA